MYIVLYITGLYSNYSINRITAKPQPVFPFTIIISSFYMAFARNDTLAYRMVYARARCRLLYTRTDIRIYIIYFYKHFIFFQFFKYTVHPPPTGRGMTDVNYFNHCCSRCQQLEVMMVSIGFVSSSFPLIESIPVNKIRCVWGVICLSTFTWKFSLSESLQRLNFCSPLYYV